MNSNIYVSTLAFLGQSVHEIIQQCIDHKLQLEFSSGLAYHEKMQEIYLEAQVVKMLHNYFPAPKVPFVLNLASSDENIRRTSIDHCKACLRLTKESNAPFFAAHAGFCVDPSPDELGQKITPPTHLDKDKNKELFIQSISEILELADELDTEFYIENNVLAPFNYDGENFLLCTESSEIAWLFDQIHHDRLGLLLDTAHLKVSCQTLGLDLQTEFQKIKPYIRAFHHSDNDGTKDNNMMISPEYWFLPYYQSFKDLIHVIEVKKISVEQIFNQIKLLIGHGNK